MFCWLLYVICHFCELKNYYKIDKLSSDDSEDDGQEVYNTVFSETVRLLDDIA